MTTLLDKDRAAISEIMARLKCSRAEAVDILNDARRRHGAPLVSDAPATSIGGAKVAIFDEGSAAVVPLHEFFAANEFDPEELFALFRAFVERRPYRIGGGAAVEFVVKLYEPGDEHITWREITCPDFDAHGDLRGAGCRSCGKVPA